MGETRTNLAGHEPVADVDIRSILWFTLGVIGLLAMAQGVVIGLFGYFTDRETATTSSRYPLAVQESTIPASPRWEGIDPSFDGQSGEVVLHRYGWIDREKGIVQVPIQVAMDYLLKESASPPAKED